MKDIFFANNMNSAFAAGLFLNPFEIDYENFMPVPESDQQKGIQIVRNQDIDDYRLKILREHGLKDKKTIALLISDLSFHQIADLNKMPYMCVSVEIVTEEVYSKMMSDDQYYYQKLCLFHGLAQTSPDLANGLTRLYTDLLK
jgi:hypothetical protein